MSKKKYINNLIEAIEIKSSVYNEFELKNFLLVFRKL
jgi:hypothetical protein